jgi:tRNA uridine 5-carbamoylmethylation protein Kti12
MTEVLIMCGLPGSGKSSWADRNIKLEGDESVVICSADDFFCKKDGVYDFVPSKLGEAHEYCFKEFFWYAERCSDSPASEYPDVKYIIVANTNTTLHEISPYTTLAKYFGLPMRVIVLECSAETAIKRNTHNVPEKTIYDMERKLKNLAFPKYWKVERYNTDDK